MGTVLVNMLLPKWVYIASGISTDDLLDLHRMAQPSQTPRMDSEARHLKAMYISMLTANAVPMPTAPRNNDSTIMDFFLPSLHQTIKQWLDNYYIMTGMMRNGLEVVDQRLWIIFCWNVGSSITNTRPSYRCSREYLLMKGIMEQTYQRSVPTRFLQGSLTAWSACQTT